MLIANKMTGIIETIEHWCPDGCGEVLEDKGGVKRVRRWVLKVNDNNHGIAFGSALEAKEFAVKYGIEINESDTTSSR